MGTDILPSTYDMEATMKLITTEISKFRLSSNKARENFLTIVFRDNDAFFKFYKEYEKMKWEIQSIDYDDMLIFCNNGFKNNPALLARYRAMYSYIMVDEFQDTSDIQYNIIKNLAAPKNNLFICGDDDQSIYGFNNAKPEIMLGFPDAYPGCGVARLSTNYRSDTDIVKAAGNLIHNNTARFEKDIVGKSKEEGHVELIYSKMDELIYQPIIRKVISENEEGVPFYDMAILTRTNKEGKFFALMCQKMNIPYYYAYGEVNLYKGALWNLLRTYLKIAYGDDSWENISFIINKPNRYVKKEYIQNSKNLDELMTAMGEGWKRKRLVDLIKFIHEIRAYASRSDSVADTMKKIWEDVNLSKWVTDHCKAYLDDESEYHERYQTLVKEMESYNDIETYLAYAEVRSKYFEQDAKRAKAAKDRGVTICTMHASKGLEWDTVFIASCNQGVIPFERQDSDCDTEEERRPMYVAVTRAKKKCYIAMKDGEPPSQFLEEAKIPGYEERFKVWDEIVEYAKEQEKRQIEESINRRRGKLRKKAAGDTKTKMPQKESITVSSRAYCQNYQEYQALQSAMSKKVTNKKLASKRPAQRKIRTGANTYLTVVK